jgi:hypothetical protein
VGGAPPLHLQLLMTVNLPRSAVNLAPSYSDLHDALVAGFATNGAVVDEEAAAPLYREARLLWGQSESVHPTVDLAGTLRAAADSGRFESPAPGSAPEQLVLAQLGATLPELTVPPELVGGQSAPLWGPPLDGLVVVTVHSTRRLCALDDAGCVLAGQAPPDFFAGVRPDGTVGWLAPPGGGAGFALARVVFLDIVTGEDETPSDFRARCAAVPGFSRTLLDDMEPSPPIYYRALATALGGRSVLVLSVDLCEALGTAGPGKLAAVTATIAARLGGGHR